MWETGTGIHRCTHVPHLPWGRIEASQESSVSYEIIGDHYRVFLNLVLQRRKLPVLWHSKGRWKGGTKRRKSLSCLPPAHWFLSHPYEVGKVQEEKNNPCAIRSKLWARQEVQDAAEWVSSNGIGMRFSFSSLGWPTKLIPSSGTPDEDMSLWPEILPFQHELPAPMTYFWQSCQKFLHKLCIGQQHKPLFKWGPSSGERVVKKVVCFPIIALNPALHLQPLFIIGKKQTKLMATDDQSWHKWPTQAMIWSFGQQQESKIQQLLLD